MIVIYLLIPLSIVIATGFLIAFIWAVRAGQFEDTHTPALRMLWDDQGTAGGRKSGAARPSGVGTAPAKKEEH